MSSKRYFNQEGKERLHGRRDQFVEVIEGTSMESHCDQ